MKLVFWFSLDSTATHHFLRKTPARVRASGHVQARYSRCLSSYVLLSYYTLNSSVVSQISFREKKPEHVTMSNLLKIKFIPRARLTQRPSDKQPAEFGLPETKNYKLGPLFHLLQLRSRFSGFLRFSSTNYFHCLHNLKTRIQTYNELSLKIPIY